MGTTWAVCIGAEGSENGKRFHKGRSEVGEASEMGFRNGRVWKWEGFEEKFYFRTCRKVKTRTVVGWENVLIVSNEL